MNTQNTQNKQLDSKNKTDAVLEKIQELIPQAPEYWKSIIAAKMGRSIESINKYVDGTRGMKSGQHKEVLRLLKELVAEENLRIQKLLS